MDQIKISVKKNVKNTTIKVNDFNFIVLNHWFWEKFNENWEPQTLNFFKRNLVKGRDYLDIGAWVGPTSLIATALGAGKVKIIEPNPMNFFHLLVMRRLLSITPALIWALLMLNLIKFSIRLCQ